MTAVDVLEKRMDALSTKLDVQAGRIDDLERENAELRRQLAEVKGHVDPDPGSKAYDELSRAEKVQIVRSQLVDVAESTHDGRAAMKYKEIMYLFDGHPSAGHCYDLMERAGQLEGFAYDTGGNGKGSKRVRVNLEAVKEPASFHAVNNAVEA